MAKPDRLLEYTSAIRHDAVFLYVYVVEIVHLLLGTTATLVMQGIVFRWVRLCVSQSVCQCVCVCLSACTKTEKPLIRN